MKAFLSNPAGQLPWPGVPGRVITGDEIVEIDPTHPFWSQCLADGTLIEVSDDPVTIIPEPQTDTQE